MSESGKSKGGLFGEEGQNLFNEIGSALGDPNEILKNPFSAIQKLMSNPDLLQKIDQMYQNPEVRQQVEESMNNPFFQSMIQSNPELNQFYDAAKSMKQQGSAADEDTYEADELYDGESDEEDEPIDGDPINWLNPPHTNEPFELPLSASALK